jgi:Uma2 family endonuclease
MNVVAEPCTLPKLQQGYQRVHLCAVSWDAYEKIGEAFLNRANIRLTYDRRNLEIMTLSPEHERLRCLLGLMVTVLAEELNIPCIAFGSTTYKQQEAERGLEPDQCFYFTNLERVRHLQRLDLTRDPVPELAIEVDITSSSMDRMGIYARLGIPEVWRWDGTGFTANNLQSDGHYLESPFSSMFISNFQLSELTPFLEYAWRTDDITGIRHFRRWLQQYIADRGLTS